MASLLEMEERSQFRSLRRGEVVEGTIISITRDGVVVDIGSKSEGLIPVNEMHSLGADPLSSLSVGEKLVAYVMQPETSEGEVLLSVDRARGETRLAHAADPVRERRELRGRSHRLQQGRPPRQRRRRRRLRAAVPARRPAPRAQRHRRRPRSTRSAPACGSKSSSSTAAATASSSPSVARCRNGAASRKTACSPSWRKAKSARAASAPSAASASSSTSVAPMASSTSPRSPGTAPRRRRSSSRSATRSTST